MKKTAFLFIAFLLFGLLAAAQVKKKIKRGRRNKSESQFALPANYIQTEWEAGVEKVNDGLSTIVHPNMAIRYGLTKRTEINLETSWVTARQTLPTGTVSLTGLEPLMPGVTVYLADATDRTPAISVSLQLGIPFLASKNFTADHIAPTVQLTFQKMLLPGFQLAVSNGAYWDGFSPNPAYIYNISPAWQFSKKWNATLECFGYINGSAPQHNGDLNLMYAVSQKAQVGFTAGTGLSAAAHKSYWALNWVYGITTRSKKRLAFR